QRADDRRLPRLEDLGAARLGLRARPFASPAGALMAKILITGGGVFLGSRLAARLAERDPGAKITLLDIAFPQSHPRAGGHPRAAGHPRLGRHPIHITGDASSPDVIAKALAKDTTSVFHLASVVSGG